MAELLLGDIALTSVGVVVAIVPLYGCVALAETLFPSRARRPWLRTRGLVVTSVVFLLTVALYWAGTFYTAGTSTGPQAFRPTAPQMIATAVTAVVLVLAAFAVRPGAVTSRLPGSVPSPVLVFAGSLVAASVVRQSADHLPGWVSVASACRSRSWRWPRSGGTAGFRRSGGSVSR